MKKTAMALTLALVAGSAFADGNGELVGGGRTDTGNIGSGCCAAQSQSGGYYGSGHAASQDDGGLLGPGGGRSDDGGLVGSGGGMQSQDGGYYGSGHSKAQQQRGLKREFRLFGFLFAWFD